jgi:hypothetical protein
MRYPLVLAALLTGVGCAKQEPPVQESRAECCTATIRALVPEGTGTLYLAGNLPELGPWEPDALAMEGAGGELRALPHRRADSAG